MKKYIIYIIMMLLLITPFVYAELTLKTISNDLDFDKRFRPNENGKPIQTNILSPDGISTIENFIVEIKGDFNVPNTVYSLNYTLNKNSKQRNCKPDFIITPNSAVYDYTMRFDCTSRAVNWFTRGKLNVTFHPITSQNVENNYIKYEMTYLNKPTGSMTIHGTEYNLGQIAIPWLQLINSTGGYINDGACLIDIYTPDGDELLEKATMTNINHDGVYIYQFPTQNLYDGVFPVIARCYFEVTEINENVDAFTLNVGNVDDGDYTDTWTLDGDEHKIEQDSGVLDIEYDVNNMCGVDTNELLLSGLTVTVNAKWKDSPVNDDINIHIYNYSSGEWLHLDNKIISPNDRTTVSNYIASNNYTRDGLVDSSGTLTLKFNDTLPSGSNKKIEMDWIQVSCEEFATPEWQEVKGSSEIHITADEYWSIKVDSGEIKNESWTGFFYYNFTVSSQTEGTRELVELSVNLPTPFPCHHVRNVSIDGVVQDTQEFLNPTDPTISGCKVEWYQNLSQGVNYQGQVIAENYFKEVERNWVTQNRIDYNMISISCETYRQDNSLPAFVIPQVTEPTDTNDFYDACQQYLDQYYHWNYTYFQEFKTPTGIFDYHEMSSLDNMWTHLLLVQHDLDQIAESLKQTMTLTGTYSTWILTNPIPTHLDYFLWLANISATRDINELLSTGEINVTINETAISDHVWNYENRNLTYTEDVFNYTLLTNYYNSINSNTSMIPQDVWSYINRNLTYYPLPNNLTSKEIWEYENRNLTYYPAQTDLTDYDRISQGVWNRTDRNLTYYPTPNNLTSKEIWTYTERNLTTTKDVFNYTYFDSQINTIPIGVWNYGTRLLTNYNNTDLTDYERISQGVWNRTNRNLTYYKETFINISNITQGIWDYDSRYTHGIII